jgi:alpha/beta superfamily hydrolase
VSTSTERIGPNTILPARRESITLRTADGLGLIGELALPADREPVATLVLLHPLPTHGGMMDSHIYRKAAYRLPALADLAVLRFNTRGTTSEAGTSDGEFAEGIDEKYDVQAAMDFAVARKLPNIWLVGWSFGTELTLKYGLRDAIEGAILISPPLHRATAEDLRRWDGSGKPVVCLVPELDDYLQPPAAREAFAVIGHAKVLDFPKTKHLWVGKAEAALDTIVATVNPDVPTPLPSVWPSS